MSNTSLTERDTSIINDYNNNLKIAEIAARNDVSEQTVLTVVRVARSEGKITREPRVRHASTIDPSRNERIVAMYAAGSTLNAIGEYFNLTRERVRQILEKSGIDRRNMTEHADILRVKTMSVYGPMVDAAFDEARSISKVAEMFKDKIPARWVRQHLEPRRNESLRTNNTPQVWTNDQIISILREASAGKGTLSIGDYRKWRSSFDSDQKRPPTHSIISWRFGSWRNAVTIAGLADNAAKREYKRRWNREDAMNAVALYVDYANELGERPTFTGYDTWSRERDEHPSAAYVRHLTGMSWSQILRSVLTRQPV